MYKILHGLVAVDSLFNIRLDTSRTRGELKILKPQCSVNCRAHSSVCRRLNCWNSLPNDVRNASSVYVYKRLLAYCQSVILRLIKCVFLLNCVRATVSAVMPARVGLHVYIVNCVCAGLLMNVIINK